MFLFPNICRNLFEIPLIINGENIWYVTKETIEVLSISNHEEADTRSISTKL